MPKILRAILVLSILFVQSCSRYESSAAVDMDFIAEAYVKLVLKVGQYNEDFVDSYCGPEEWRPISEGNAQIEEFPYQEFKTEAGELIDQSVFVPGQCQ